MSRTSWNDYSAELAAIRGNDPDQPTPDELDYSDSWRPPYTGPAADHAWPGWGGCDCGLPLRAHRFAADMEQQDRAREEGLC